jgi:hypothetical protein
MAGDVRAGPSLRAGSLLRRQRVGAGARHGPRHAERLAAPARRDASERALVVGRAGRIVVRRIATRAAAGTCPVGSHPFLMHLLRGLGCGGRSPSARGGRRGRLRLRRGLRGLFRGRLRLRGGRSRRLGGLRGLFRSCATRNCENHDRDVENSLHGAEVTRRRARVKHAQAGTARARRGSTTRNLVPSPGDELTEIEPSCARTICRTM